MSKRAWKLISAALAVLLAASLCFAYVEHQEAARARATVDQMEAIMWQLHYKLLEANSQRVCPVPGD